MNDRETNSLMMFKAVRDNFSEHAALVATVPALERLSRTLNEKVLEIEETAKRHDSITAGKTDIKHSAKEMLLDQIRVKSAVLYAYAKKVGDLEALALARTPDYRIRVLRDEELIRSSEVLYEALLKAGEGLVEFGISETGAKDFRAALDEFRRALGTRDSSKSARSVSRSTLTALFSAVRELLAEEVDPIMELFRVSHPVFFDTYRALRVTKALAVRHRKEAEPLPAEGTASAVPLSVVTQPVVSALN